MPDGGVAISVLLPTVRPHLLQRAFASIAPAENWHVPFEVVVVADFGPTISDPHCTWIVRSRNGVVDALNAACGVAKGEYIFSFNDESVLSPAALEILHDEAEMFPGRLLTPRHLPPYRFEYYGLPFAPFPFVHRDLLAKLGGLADPAYKQFYSDPDLSLRAHAQGVPVRTVEAAVIRHTQDIGDPIFRQNFNAYRSCNREVFMRRWAHLGEFSDP